MAVVSTFSLIIRIIEVAGSDKMGVISCPV